MGESFPPHQFPTGIDLRGQRAVGAQDPVSASDLATKNYTDGQNGKQAAGVNQTLTAVAPSATANTYGTAQSVVLTGTAMSLLALELTSAGTNGTETVTLRVTATFSDGTTANYTTTFTTDTSQKPDLLALTNLTADGERLTALAIDAKSTATSSAATVTPQVIGVQFI